MAPSPKKRVQHLMPNHVAAVDIHLGENDLIAARFPKPHRLLAVVHELGAWNTVPKDGGEVARTSGAGLGHCPPTCVHRRRRKPLSRRGERFRYAARR